jgi:Ca2+-binding RTX toxin-like protein
LDSGADNTYNLTVTASDGSLTSSKAVALTVTDLNEIQGNPLINNGRNPIVGTAGPDYLTGGAGAKTLTGGGGNDSFVFTDMRDVGQRVADFTVGEDKLVFTQLFSSLGYKGSNPIADGYLKFVQGTGANSAHTFLQIDRDGLTGSAISRNFLQVDNITPTQLNNINNFQF